MPNILSLLILLPLLGALLTLVTPAKMAKHVAVTASLLPLGAVAVALWNFNPFMPGMQLVETRAWLPQFGLYYSLGVDGIALPLMALTALLTPMCLLASWHITKYTRAFFASFLALEAAVMGVFAAQNFVLFYVFWEAMLIPMFLLIGIWGGENRIYAALKFFLYTFLGSVLMLVAGLYMGRVAGSFELGDWVGLSLPLMTQQLLFLAFFAAFAVKVPMWPFHTWLPDAHVQAPTGGSVILAGILLKMGAYGFLRFCLPMWPQASHYFAPMIVTLSAIAVVYAALVAYAQTDIKKLIAYSSVSHMGLVTLGIFSGTALGLNGAMLVMLNHGIVSAGLFLAVGVVYERLHTRDLAKFGGIVQLMPAYAFVVMVLTLAAVALPGTNGFVGEFMSLAGSWPVAPVATGVSTLGVILGALYMLWLYRKMILGTPSTFVESHKSHMTDLNGREWATFLPLLILVPLLGMFPALATDLWQKPVQMLQAVYNAPPAPPVMVPAAIEAPVLQPEDAISTPDQSSTPMQEPAQ
jgi:NADH-quinone oxidoreductase subunit M